MKPISLFFFFTIIVSALVFGGIYLFAKEFVEANAPVFAIGLVSIMIVGMFGMMSYIPSTVRERNRDF